MCNVCKLSDERERMKKMVSKEQGNTNDCMDENNIITHYAEQ